MPSAHAMRAAAVGSQSEGDVESMKAGASMQARKADCKETRIKFHYIFHVPQTSHTRNHRLSEFTSHSHSVHNTFVSTDHNFLPTNRNFLQLQKTGSGTLKIDSRFS
jgi:hypothetical protein